MCIIIYKYDKNVKLIMICDKHKTVFIHIPRNAGRSVCEALGVSSKDLPEFRSITEIEKKNPIAILSYYKWTIVRNPWERELSLYNYALEENIIDNKSFEDYLEMVKSKSINNSIIQKNQIDYFTQNHYVQVDQIVRLEYISTAWKKICEQIKIEKIDLQHINKSKNQENQYTQESMRLVAEIRKQDIEFLKYDFPN